MQMKRCWCGSPTQPSIHEEYLKCSNCGTFISKYEISNEKLKNFYTFDSYWHDHVVNKFGYPSIEERSEVDFKDRIPLWFSVLKKFKPDAKSVLEIGCAHGGFLYLCKEHGVEKVVGVEVDEKTCEFARKKFNLENIIPGLFPDVQLPLKKFDVIAGFDVLEHFTDPIKALKKVNELLDENGICIFQTPRYQGEDDSWLHFKSDEHLYLFSAENIFLLFDKAGLEVVQILPGPILQDMIVVGRKKINVDNLVIRSPQIEFSDKLQIIGIGLIEHMGDIVACEPVSRYIRFNYPDAHIVWCVRKDYKELIDSNPYIDETIEVNCLTEWIALKESGIFDEVFDLHIHNRICPVCQVPLQNNQGKVVVTGENYYKIGNLLSAFSQNAGLPALSGKPKVYITEEAKKKVDKLNLPPKFIVFHCKTNETSRDWRNSKWVELAKQIKKNYDIEIVEVGLDSVLAGGNVEFINLCGKLSILETAEVIKRALIFIGVDSGPAHLANAVGTFGIILLGQYRNFKRYMPFSGDYESGENAVMIWADGPASEIKVEEVMDVLETSMTNLLGSERKGSSSDEIKIYQQSKSQKKARLIAFFLPQFHPIPENDEWWGKGFTEWRNVTTAKPLFPGHYQPRIPADLGFYDLRLPEVRKEQAELAQRYGIDAFCYWHYWFNGKTLLEKPLLEILNTVQPDFQFCLAWANENWTRRWDGLNNEILLEQTYGGVKDHLNHFEWLLPFFKDPRYFKIDGKPVFLIYRPSEIPNLKEMIEIWRRLAKKSGIGDLFLIAIRASAGIVDNWKTTGFDGEVIFQPFFKALTFELAKRSGLPLENLNLIFDYEEAVKLMSELNEEITKRGETSFACVTPSWDNSPRRKRSKPFIFTNSSPNVFEKWLRLEIERVQKRNPEHRIVFINAWNEWAEGNYLEPDLKFGHAYLEAVKRAVFDIPWFSQGKGKRKIFTLDSDDTTIESILDFARSNLSENNIPLADKYFKLALRYNANLMALFYHNAKLYHQPGRTEQYKTFLEKLNYLEKLNSQIHNDYAVMKYKLGDVEKATFHLQRAIFYDTTNITAMKNIADIFISEQKFEEAIQIYQKILQLNPNDLETLLSIASICVEIGKIDDAKFFYTKVLEIDPNNPEARKTLESIEKVKTSKPLVSIIIPVFNQLHYTKIAIESIKRYTHTPYEIIVVDNGSTDGTYEYLSSLGVIKVIRNPKNYGFPKAVNQGLSASSGEYVVILNNDVIVTNAWLERLLEHIREDNSIGIIGPLSNYTSGFQILNGAEKSYMKNGEVDEEFLQKFANELYMQNKGQKVFVPRIAGLCMLIKREVLNKIGGFDERFSPGNFEDDDYCLRATFAGFKIAIAKDVFIHHFGSKSFKANGNQKFLEILRRNEKIFVEKWGAKPIEIFMKGKTPKENPIFIPLKSKTEFANATNFTLHDS
jgi:GT2 family glycosyltransferase/ADP-heptose:LPS heptosyltransferase/2-polyprenyl-3-methyl-5-hydroxy-6-metoxy-1,4-benzoquinol methylase/Tfp pilus assembly protein PilF